jgi:hypothetical protein
MARGALPGTPHDSSFSAGRLDHALVLATLAKRRQAAPFI